MSPKLILASGSPRRRELLTGLGLTFSVRPVDLDETPLEGEDPSAYVTRLAAAKARARSGPDELTLAADTIVVLDDELLGKPGDPAEAREMLGRLAGREHQVLTGVAVYESKGERLVSGVESSRVTIAALSDEEIAWYVATGEPLDKAGSYAIQDLGALFVERVEGNYTNVVGLPLPLTYSLFGQLGFNFLSFRNG
jgi:septum formation protein